MPISLYAYIDTLEMTAFTVSFVLHSTEDEQEKSTFHLHDFYTHR